MSLSIPIALLLATVFGFGYVAGFAHGNSRVPAFDRRHATSEDLDE